MKTWTSALSLPGGVSQQTPTNSHLEATPSFVMCDQDFYPEDDDPLEEGGLNLNEINSVAEVS